MSKRWVRGYTVVELMMALAVFTIGAAGVVALQRAVAVSNQHAKNLAVATQIAQAWIAELHADALQWNFPGPQGGADDLSQTHWLSQITASPGVWAQPSYSAASARNFGPAFDALGNVVNPNTNAAQAQFCTNLRLTWLYNPNLMLQRTEGVIRAEVRVFWPKTGLGVAANICNVAITTGAGGNSNNFHVVQSVAAIRQYSLLN